ncbi:MAG: hypothetical protein KDI88_10300 [Gammaproteobacteria bacterium]|nr:hypothetical protein [Gammaproteobacteria bacterium]
MTPGYLSIETSESHPNLVRLIVSREQPDPEPALHGDRRIRYIARFNDSEASLMHLHELLKRRLVDPDTHLYRASYEQAIAAADSLDLRHQALYLDCDLDDAQRQRIAEMTERYIKRRRLIAKVFETMGYIGLLLLLLNMWIVSRM